MILFDSQRYIVHLDIRFHRMRYYFEGLEFYALSTDQHKICCICGDINLLAYFSKYLKKKL